MTAEKAIEILSDVGDINRCCAEDAEALDMAIKALEQEDVFDKIRAEIENHCGLIKEDYCKYCGYCNSVMGVREILQIIDKYKAESEEEK